MEHRRQGPGGLQRDGVPHPARGDADSVRL